MPGDQPLDLYRLAQDWANSAFACGEWRRGDTPDYSELIAEQERAQRAFTSALKAHNLLKS